MFGNYIKSPMKAISKFKPILFLSLKIWIIYVFLLALQDTYHEVNCEGGFNGFIDVTSYALSIFLFFLIKSFHLVICLFLFYFLLHKIKLSISLMLILFFLGTTLICIISFPGIHFLTTFYEIDIDYSELFSHIIRAISSHFLISNNFIAAPIPALILLIICRNKIISMLSKQSSNQQVE